MAREVELLVVARAEGREPGRDGVVRARLDLHVVRRVGVEQVDRRAAEEPVEVFGTGAVAAEHAVLAQHPEVAGLRRGGVRRFRDLVLGDLLLGAQVRLDLGQQGVDVLRRVPDRVERVLGPQLVEESRQGGLVPLGELVGAVVRDAKGRGLQVRALEADHGDLGHPQIPGRLQPRVPRHDLAGGLGDDGLLPAEPPQGRRDVGDGGVVLAGIRGVLKQAVEGDPLDRQGALVHDQASSSGPNPDRRVGEPAWNWVLGVGRLPRDAMLGVW